VLIYLFMRHRLNRLGESAVRGNEQRFQVVSEAFGTLDELKLYGRVADFARRYDAPGRAFAWANALSMVISQTPRFVLEPLAFGSIVVIVLFALWSGGNIAAVLPVAGLFAYAGYRLMPAFQNIFVATSSIRFYRPAVRIVVDAVSGEEEAPLRDERTSAVIPFSHAIELRDLSIALSDSGRATLRSISLDIHAHTMVGLVGKTGCGKSTLVGVITGLLRPTSGTVSIDGRLLDEESLPGWQRHIGYVPQEIVLTDDTVSANIALGVPEEKIDRQAVERAARIAGIHAFIEAELPGGYDGRVGERGARISGGQRQRIGIARALYHDPDVIIFDEATSALDNETEQAVMKAIEELAGTRTIIMIAHRLTTLRRADVIHLMDEGRIIESGRLADIAPRLGDAVA
jgi:ABC-type multidrug transport system fused ATPase/permease subunit